MVVKFDEEKLLNLGYRWNSHKDYMFKSSEVYTINKISYSSVVIVYPNGEVEIESPSNLSDKMISELKEVL